MRSKKMVVLSHCILNVNSKVEGFEPFSPMIRELVDELDRQGYGIIQLPCPEILLLGMRRWGVVKDQLSHDHAKDMMRRMIRPIIEQIRSYRDVGYTVSCVIGIDGSPSCGVNFTCKSDRWKGELGFGDLQAILKDVRIEKEMGIFMELLKEAIDSTGQKIFTAAFIPRVAGNLIDKIGSCILVSQILRYIPHSLVGKK